MKKINVSGRTKFVIIGFFLLMTSFLQYYMMELACKPTKEVITLIEFKYLLIGCFTILFVDAVLIAITNRFFTSLNIANTLFLIFSIINYYTYKLHGSPLTLSEFKNTGTALNVLENYSITFDRRIYVMAFIFIFLCICNFILYKFLNIKLIRKYSWIGSVCCLPVVILLYIFVVPSVFWNWTTALVTYGYTPTAINMSVGELNPVVKPNNFNEDELISFMDSYEKTIETKNITPDIILILNESWYDMSSINNFTENPDAFSYLSELDGAIVGKCVNPVIGGATNKSEWELLTSNSNYLIPTITPFLSLNMKDSNTVSSFLQSLGYTSYGCHPANKINYNRSIAYPAIGFDEIKFIDDFENQEFYGDREFLTDLSAYRNAENWYEEMGYGPRFLYLLTIQNHGGYSLNEGGDIVNITDSNFTEERKIEMQEYESIMKLSCDALKEFISYYENSDRDVIICMAGDHCPDLARAVVDESLFTNDVEREVALRHTPFVIWSNNKELLKTSLNTDTISMNFLVPTVLECAGVELSPWYDYLINLRNQYPVIFADGGYLENNIKKDFTDDIDKYLGLCYLNIKEPAKCNGFF